MLEPTPSTGPTDLHRRMLARRYGMFIHFGLNTFHDREWTDGTLDPSTYAPTGLDTDQWAATARDAGMKYVILTAKHHEGFCLWPTAHGDYGVARSPVTTDVVGAMARSCEKAGIELGIYYSLWDRHWGDGLMRPLEPGPMSDADAARYLSTMLGHLGELLGNYGPVCELWLDGGWVQPRGHWHMPEIYELARRLQPHCAVSANWTIGRPGDPDAHLVLPEQQREGFPFRYFPSDFRLGDPYLPADPDPKLFDHEGRLYYLPFESTVCLNRFWFFNTGDGLVRPVEELAALYRRATAQDNILILNSPPDRAGRMTGANVRRLRELALELGIAP